MMAYSDVLVTVYSTMLVETAVHDTAMIAATIDTPGGWNKPGKFSLSLKRSATGPRHKRSARRRLDASRRMNPNCEKCSTRI